MLPPEPTPQVTIVPSCANTCGVEQRTVPAAMKSTSPAFLPGREHFRLDIQKQFFMWVPKSGQWSIPQGIPIQNQIVGPRPGRR